MTVLVRLAYDGTDFHGYARQLAAPGRPEIRTVQGTLEAALADFYSQPVQTRAASRTDAGVHALGQVVGWEPPHPIPARGLMLGLLARLPRDLGVLAVWEASLADGAPVDPRFWNLGKRYRYRIRSTPRRLPQTIRGEWHLPRALDVAAMQAAARHFAGEHDFAGFRASACQSRTTVRRLHAVTVTGRPSGDELPADPRCEVHEGGSEMGKVAEVAEVAEVVEVVEVGKVVEVVEIDVRGEAFLQNMVRIIVGTLVEVGLGRRAPDSIPALLLTPDRRRSGATAPPQGLTLVEVLWPASWPPSDGVAALDR